MPYAGQDFSPTGIGSIELFSFDYVNLLASGETISSATWTATLSSGTDDSPNSIVSGSATISGSVVTQLIDLTDTAQVINANAYLLTCAAETSLGQTLLIWAHLVAITPA